MSEKRPNTGWLRRYVVTLIPWLTDSQAAEIEAAYVLAHRCSVCGGNGRGVRRYQGVFADCWQCDGHGLTWPTTGLTLDPRHVRELAATVPPLDAERASALAGVDRAVQRAIETRSPAVETPATATLSDGSRRGVQTQGATP